MTCTVPSSQLCIWKNQVRADPSRASSVLRGRCQQDSERGVWAPEVCFHLDCVPAFSVLCWEIWHWLLSGEGERDGETPLSGGPGVPLCSGETMGMKTPSAKSQNVPCLAADRETAPCFYGNIGHLKMPQTMEHIQSFLNDFLYVKCNIYFVNN